MIQNETTMDSVNDEVKEHSSGTAATGRERTKLVLVSVNAMGKGTATAVAGTLRQRSTSVHSIPPALAESAGKNAKQK